MKSESESALDSKIEATNDRLEAIATAAAHETEASSPSYSDASKSDDETMTRENDVRVAMTDHEKPSAASPTYPVAVVLPTNESPLEHKGTESKPAAQTPGAVAVPGIPANPKEEQANVGLGIPLDTHESTETTATTYPAVAALSTASLSSHDTPEQDATLAAHEKASAVSTSYPAASPTQDARQTPGAVAVPGALDTEEIIEANVGLNTESATPEPAFEVRPSVMVEATAVQEIVATQVVAEPLEIESNLLQVDIDNFEETMAPEDKDQHSRLVPMILILVFLITVFAIIAWLNIMVVPSREELAQDLRYNETGYCPDQQVELLYHTHMLLGLARIELNASNLVVFVLTYRMLDSCQDKLCRRQEGHPRIRGDFYFNYVTLILEVFWILTCLAGIIYLEVHDVDEPAFLLGSACFELDTFVELAENYLGEMDDLDPYLMLGMLRIPCLAFLIVARCRLVFFQWDCNNLRPFWRRVWFWVKVLLDAIAYALMLAGVYGCLVPVLEQLEDFAPP